MTIENRVIPTVLSPAQFVRHVCLRLLWWLLVALAMVSSWFVVGRVLDTGLLEK